MTRETNLDVSIFGGFRLASRSCIWVAYSGGLDSTALLHLLRLAFPKRVRAAHVNHGLQPQADEWEERCRQQCGRWRVPFRALRVRVAGDDPQGLEAAAREARFAALRGCLKKSDVLALAHHRDDQAETVLLRLLRGAGVEGLAAMRAIADFPPGVLWRPLLQTPRAELLDYARRHGLRWIDDPHNEETRFARVWLRREILPGVHTRWPRANEALARAAQHCAEASDLLAELARTDLAPLRRGEGLSVAGLLALPAARRRNALRAWLREGDAEAPSAEMLARAEREVLHARADAAPLLNLGDRELRRYRDTLYAMAPLPPAPAGVQIEWNGRGTLQLPAGCGELKLRGRRRTSVLTVGFPRGGEKLKPAGAAHTRALKNLFQETEVPPWVRARTPLIYLEGQLAAVGDRWCMQAWQALGLRVKWRPPPMS